MRAVSFTWGSVERTFVPTIAVLAAMASDLSRISEGQENTLTLARKINAGGADPVFAATALWHMLKASGADLTREAVYEQMMGDEIPMLEKIEWRTSYLASVLPQVDQGKKPKAPAVPQSKPRASRKK